MNVYREDLRFGDEKIESFRNIGLQCRSYALQSYRPTPKPYKPTPYIVGPIYIPIGVYTKIFNIININDIMITMITVGIINVRIGYWR